MHKMTAEHLAEYVRMNRALDQSSWEPENGDFFVDDIYLDTVLVFHNLVHERSDKHNFIPIPRLDQLVLPDGWRWENAGREMVYYQETWESNIREYIGKRKTHARSLRFRGPFEAHARLQAVRFAKTGEQWNTEKGVWE